MFHLQLRNELWKLFGKKRTYIGFAMFLLAQNVIILVHRFTHHVTNFMVRLLEANGFEPKRYITILTISTVMVTTMALTLLPLYAALVGGDLMAKEAEDGTLRMILSRPVTRFRLVILKWLAGGIFSVVLVLSLGAFGLLFTSFWFPWGSLFTVAPLPFGAFEPARGLWCYVVAHLCMFPATCTMMTLAFMFSCFNMKPAAATILALSVMFISMIMQNLPFFADYRTYFITYDMNIWRELFAQRVPWWQIGESFTLLAGYNLTFLVVGATVFQMRDIKS